jgi:probable addiction module antidote protein
MAIELRNFDPSIFLESDEAIMAYLEEALATGDAKLVAVALGDVARVKGMGALAKQAGVSRESLYRALSEDGNPQLSTVLKVLDALGLQLKVEGRHRDAAE